MSWAKIDDRANEHRKLLAAGAEACWLWTCGLMYANRQDARDGYIPAQAIGMLYPVRNAKRVASKLVEVGLWEEAPGGYLVHDFAFWNQTKEQRQAELESGRARAAKSYQNRKAKNSSPEDSTEEDSKNSVSSGRGVEGVVESGLRSPDPEQGIPPDPPRDPKALAEAALRDPMSTQAKHGNVETWPEVLAVCATFAATYGRQDMPKHQGDPRARVILGRLAEGHTVAQLEAAVRGSKFADYIANNQANQALVTILRDSAQVDKFGALKSPSGGPRLAVPPPRQPNYGYDVIGAARRQMATDDERRRIRNRMLGDAEQGDYGPEVQARAAAAARTPGPSGAELADELERGDHLKKVLRAVP